ncbi:hypothetical protein [Bradymonas sediminis]|nr:hypothetical protein [Bradymonas sediminis]TDP64431.1 hypothetical protein DFR33_10992 [Bradymonas sediminis]
MDVPQFEQAILKLAFETDARITTASVAYYLGLPSRRCNELLNALLAEGVLELDSDGEGNLFYRVPNKPAGSDAVMGQLRQERENPFAASNRLLIGTSNPEDQAAAQSTGASMVRAQNQLPSGVRFVSPGDDEDNSEPLRVHAHTRAPEPSLDTQPGSGSWGSAASPSGRERQASPRRTLEPLAGVARRHARPDATINRCGASPLLVSDSVRCDPKPVAARRPVLTSCAEPKAVHARKRSTQADDSIWGAKPDQWPVVHPSSPRRVFGESIPNRATMLASRPGGGDLAIRDDALTQPEHQPGMALLLSLILCGTGQIYNGEVSKGIMMMVLCFLLWFVLLGWVVHIWSIVDSVVVAERVNRSNG